MIIMNCCDQNHVRRENQKNFKLVLWLFKLKYSCLFGNSHPGASHSFLWNYRHVELINLFNINIVYFNYVQNRPF